MRPSTGNPRRHPVLGPVPRVLAPALFLVASAACSAGAPGDGSPAAPVSPAPSAVAPSASTTPPVGTPGSSPSSGPSAARAPFVRPSDLDPTTAVRVVRHLAGRIGPRPATGAAHRRAARWVGDRLAAAGLEVEQQRLQVPGGSSWGVEVPAGRSTNVVASPPGFDARRPHLLLGAHLDTVPQSPGAEDNASGVGVLVAVAEALEGRRTRLPVVLVAFGAEEPRGPGDDDHHYGSRHLVATMPEGQRRALRGMVSLDRVGVGSVVPVCSAGPPGPARGRLLAAAGRAGVPAAPCEGNRASDHWSFVRNGLPGLRLGSTPYAGYHSAADVPDVVDPAQLTRTGRIVLAWLGRPDR